jgi:hypothetical protein
LPVRVAAPAPSPKPTPMPQPLPNPVVPASATPAPPVVPQPPAKSWQDLLYPNCLLNNWQMNESERLALTALLLRHKPNCSIEIGTYHGGSLSLIAQHSTTVVSIDIDPEVLTRVGDIPNVHFLTGYSEKLLPPLFAELTRSGVAIDFILVDGDHSTDGIKRDIGLILDYVPTKPMFVLLHDSFNPGCRRGMLEGGWERSPYCQAVELDFVPGRMIEDSGPADGEFWGGLGMAYFHPVPRTNPLVIGRAADRMLQALSNARQKAGA